MKIIGRYLLAWCVVWTMVALGQPTGEIRGMVSDPSGAPVPGARLTLQDMGTREAVSGARGEFMFPGLPPGTYTLRCEVAGFQPVVITTRSVIGKPQILQVRLALEKVRAEIEVGEEENGVSERVAQRGRDLRGARAAG